MATTSTGTHNKNSSFFTRRPQDWSLAEFLAYRHHPTRDPVRILDSWRRALQDIASCRSKCHTDAQRVRATNLLARFIEKGAGSDRLLGRKWLQDQKTPTATPGQTINFAPVFNSDVNGSAITLTNSTGSAGGDLESLPTRAAETGFDQDEDYNDNNEDCDDQDKDCGDKDSGNDDEDCGENEDDPFSLSVPDPIPTSKSSIDPIKVLTTTYNLQTHRWRLSSGRYVETILYENCCLMEPRAFAASLAPSFTIDLEDPIVCDWFYIEELDEIKKSVPTLPMTSPSIVAMFRSLRRFEECKTPAEIRNVLATTSFLSPGETYNPELDFLRMWADLAIRNILVIWESPRCPLRSTHLEDFYSNLVWAPTLDHCFLSLPSTTIVRKESTCRSTASRKNRTRTLQTRMHQGRRLDGVIRSIEDNTHEFGGMEVARSASGGTTSTKRLGDARKLLRALRDMLGVLCELVGWEKEVTEKLEVVGVLCAGLKMQVVRMGCCQGGGVAVVHREAIVEVPVNVEELKEMMKVLVMVASMKAVIERSVKAVRERHQKKSDMGKSDEELMKEMMEGPVVGAKLGWAADTP